MSDPANVLPKVPNTIIVVTTDGDGAFLERYWAAVVREWAFDAVQVLVVPVRGAPSALFERCARYCSRGLRVDCPTAREQGDFLARRGLAGLAAPGGAGRRNIGYLMALERGFDVMVSGTDDLAVAQDDLDGGELLFQTRAVAPGGDEVLRVCVPQCRVTDGEAFGVIDPTGDVAAHRDVLPALFDVDPAGLPPDTQLAADAGRTLGGYLLQACVKRLGHQVGSSSVQFVCDEEEDGTPRFDVAARGAVGELAEWLGGATLHGAGYGEAYRSLAEAVEDAAERLARQWPYSERAALRQVARSMRHWSNALDVVQRRVAEPHWPVLAAVA